MVDEKIHVDLEEIPAGLADGLKNQAFVLDITTEDNTLIIKVPKKGDHRKTISKYLIDKNLVPLRLAEKSISLEEAFVSITKENINLFANIGGQE